MLEELVQGLPVARPRVVEAGAVPATKHRIRGTRSLTWRSSCPAIRGACHRSTLPLSIASSGAMPPLRWVASVVTGTSSRESAPGSRRLVALAGWASAGAPTHSAWYLGVLRPGLEVEVCRKPAVSSTPKVQSLAEYIAERALSGRRPRASPKRSTARRTTACCPCRS